MMRRSASPLLLVLLALMSVAVGAPATAPSSRPTPALKVGQLVPADGAVIDVMGLKPNPRLDDLTARFRQAVEKDPEWWQTHVGKAKPGEPLNWDPRLGLSKDEYSEFLRLFDRVELAKVKSLTAKVRRQGDRVRIEFGQGLPNLRQVEIDWSANSVATPFGVLTKPHVVTAADGRRFFNQWEWEGIEWGLEKSGGRPAEGTWVTFTLARMSESGRGIIYYSATDTSREAKTRVDYILQFDLSR